MKKIRPSFTEEEFNYVQHILWHFTDYISFDDREDHGMGILKHYRDMPQEKKNVLLMLAGKLRRLSRKRRDKK